MKEQKVLNQIQSFSNQVAYLQGIKAKHEKWILDIDIQLNDIMKKYHELCQKLIK